MRQGKKISLKKITNMVTPTLLLSKKPASKKTRNSIILLYLPLPTLLIRVARMGIKLK